MLETIKYNDKVLAIVVRSHDFAEGINFVTPSNFSQQLAHMHHPTGKVILPHVHNQVVREIFYTQEVLLIKRGKMRMDLYDDDKNYLESRILKAGDIVLLATGGHGFTVLDEIEMVEVKQGPHVGDHDKTRFTPVDDALVIIKE
jgi:mannose-6-phosphate isomerase-like protein (cupin superfamily)